MRRAKPRARSQSKAPSKRNEGVYPSAEFVGAVRVATAGSQLDGDPIFRLVVDLVTDWTQKRRSCVYFVYDGNQGPVAESPMLRGRDGNECPHFSLSEVGDPVAQYL